MSDNAITDARLALIACGVKPRDALRAVVCAAAVEDQPTTSDVFRRAMRWLRPQR